MTNATVTITRRGVDYDSSTGYREAATTNEPILSDVSCLLSEAKGSRSVNSEGLREYAKPVPALLIEKIDMPDQEVELKPGDQAAVTSAGLTRTYTVNDAMKVAGIGAWHWELSLEAIKTP